MSYIGQSFRIVLSVPPDIKYFFTFFEKEDFNCILQPISQAFEI